MNTLFFRNINWRHCPCYALHLSVIARSETNEPQMKVYVAEDGNAEIAKSIKRLSRVVSINLLGLFLCLFLLPGRLSCIFSGNGKTQCFSYFFYFICLNGHHIENIVSRIVDARDKKSLSTKQLSR